jgi:hypothetical protein
MSIVGFDLSDERWPRLLGGYRLPYDPREALRSLGRSDDIDGAWGELWQELHHQGDIGEVSFAARWHLVDIHVHRGVPDWNTYAFAATIELARANPRNPELPTYLRASYDAAWARLVDIGLRELKEAQDPALVVSIIAVLAIGKGQRTLGRLAVDFTEDERQELLKGEGWL